MSERDERRHLAVGAGAPADPDPRRDGHLAANVDGEAVPTDDRTDDRTDDGVEGGADDGAEAPDPDPRPGLDSDPEPQPDAGTGPEPPTSPRSNDVVQAVAEFLKDIEDGDSGDGHRG